MHRHRKSGSAIAAPGTRRGKIVLGALIAKLRRLRQSFSASPRSLGTPRPLAYIIPKVHRDPVAEIPPPCGKKPAASAKSPASTPNPFRYISQRPMNPFEFPKLDACRNRRLAFGIVPVEAMSATEPEHQIRVSRKRIECLPACGYRFAGTWTKLLIVKATLDARIPAVPPIVPHRAAGRQNACAPSAPTTRRSAALLPARLIASIPRLPSRRRWNRFPGGPHNPVAGHNLLATR